MSDLPEQIVTTAPGLTACCQYLAGCRQFGFDTEFVGEQSYHPRLCLIQVATAERLFLIDPLSVGALDVFWNLVVDPARVVIVHAGREEVRLCRLWTGQTPGNLFDLQIAAGLVGLSYPLSHSTLVHQVLGVQMDKAETLTEWGDRPLTARQIRYAFDDVRYLLPLWRELNRRLEELGRSEWAREEFVRLINTATPAEPVEEKWRKLRGLGLLDRRELAVVRELFRWREEIAAQANRPPRTIVRDDLLVEVARRSPRRERDLHVVRGLPRRHVESILHVVTMARSLPPDQHPAISKREQDPPQASLLANVLSAVLGHFCVQKHLAANLVAGSQDIRSLVRARIQNHSLPHDSLLANGWRSQHVLPVLLAFLDGRRSLRVGDLQADAPFDLTDTP